MLAESSPNRLTIMKGGVTMRVPSSDIEARVAVLEAYVDIPTKHNGTTVTGRLEAQHKLLIAIQADYAAFRADYTAFRADYTAFRAEFNALRAEFNAFRAETNRRLTTLEDMTGQVLHGMTEIKRLLVARDGSP
jgi:ABC-type phosphate transport system auxiliary subunit